MPDILEPFRARKAAKVGMRRERRPGGEPPNRTRTPSGRKPGRAPKEGDTRRVRIQTNPPKTVVQVYRNGQWINTPSAGKGAGTSDPRKKKPMPKKNKKRKGMDLNDAIESMQKRKPWN